MRSLLFVALATLFVALLPSTHLALAQPDTLHRLKESAGQVVTIWSEFTQEKRLSIFNQILQAKGVFAFERPGSLRWEYLEPVRSGFVLHGDTGKQWNELVGNVRDFSVRKDPIMQIVSSQILLWTTLNLAELSKTYGIEVESDRPAVLRFTPLEGAQGPIAGMRITFTSDDAAIASIEIFEKEGDSTTIRFHGTRLNGILDEKVFTKQ